MSKTIYAIKNSENRFCDKHSIWFDRETKKWQYDSLENYFNYCKLHNSVEEARETLKLLQSLLPNINNQDEVFTIVPINLESESTLPDLFAITTDTGKYISESMIFQDPETEEWLYRLNEKPVHMCLCYKEQIEDVISRLKEKQKLAGLSFDFHAEQVIM